MQNILDIVKSAISEHLIEEPNIPLHTGEVMNIWLLYTYVDEAKRFCVMSMNHTNDSELSHLLEDVITGLEDKIISKLSEFMKTNGIPLPAVAAPKTISDPDQVPQGAKFTDSEIANAISLKIVSGALLCTRGITESTRDDVGLIFTEFLTLTLAYGYKVKKIMQKRGWLLIPPYYYAPGIPIQHQ